VRRRTLLPALSALLLPRRLRAATAPAGPFDLSPRLAPGLRIAVELHRRREVFDEGRWVVEARSAARAHATTRAASGGVLLDWRWTHYGADESGDGAPADPLRVRMARLWEEVDFTFRFDSARGPVLADARAARTSLLRALDAALADVRTRLVAEGRSGPAVDAALAEVRRRFLAPFATDADLARSLLQEPAFLFELAGVRIGPGGVAEQELERFLDFAPGLSWPMRVRDRLLMHDPDFGLVRLDRHEWPSRPLDRRLLLDRIPGLAAMWERLPESGRAEALAALPPAIYERVSRIEAELAGARLPRRIVRSETSGLGTLRRRLITELTVAVRGGARG